MLGESVYLEERRAERLGQGGSRVMSEKPDDSLDVEEGEEAEDVNVGRVEERGPERSVLWGGMCTCLGCCSSGNWMFSDICDGLGLVKNNPSGFIISSPNCRLLSWGCG